MFHSTMLTSFDDNKLDNDGYNITFKITGTNFSTGDIHQLVHNT